MFNLLFFVITVIIFIVVRRSLNLSSNIYLIKINSGTCGLGTRVFYEVNDDLRFDLFLSNKHAATFLIFKESFSVCYMFNEFIRLILNEMYLFFCVY